MPGYKGQCVLAIWSIILYGWCNEIVAAPFVTQTIEILINTNPDNEITFDKGNSTKIGPISDYLINALAEEECILIFNSSLLAWVMNYVSQEPLENADQEKIREKNKDLFERFKPAHWIKIKSGYLYIFVPDNYIKTRSNTSHLDTELKKNDKKTSFTLEELTVGIQWSNSKVTIIKDKDFDDTVSSSNLPIDLEELELINNLNKVLIPQKEYHQLFSNLSNDEVKALMPQSAVIVSGHGSAYDKKDKKGGLIANVTPEIFGNLLAYLSKNLVVKLLVVMSCYAAELNLHSALEFTAKTLDQKIQDLALPFAFITGAASNTPTVSVPRETFFPSTKDFFGSLNQKEFPSEREFADALHSIYDIDLSQFNNVPMIKYKDLPWKIMDIFVDNVVNIDDTLAQTYGKKTLDISTFFKGRRFRVVGKTRIEKEKKYEKEEELDEAIYPAIIALKAHDIPFNITISSMPQYVGNRGAPYWVSTIPGDSIQTIASLDASDFYLQGVISSFLPSSYSSKKDPLEIGLKDWKVFNIKKLIAKNGYEKLDKNTIDKPIKLNNVWMIKGHGQDIVLFEYNKQFWLIDLTKDVWDEEKAGPTEITEEEFNQKIAQIPEIKPQKKQKDLSEVKKVVSKKSKKLLKN